MPIQSITAKCARKLRAKLVALTRSSFFYPALYGSWWHSILHNGDRAAAHSTYMAAWPHTGAGIGHQMANWIAGLWFAARFGVGHAHVPFPSKNWERLLGFGEGAVTMDDLAGREYKRVRLPLFDENNPTEVERIRRIIASYQGAKVVCLLEQDQFYRDQFGLIDELQRRFHAAPARHDDQLRFQPRRFNVAIHVRRGDIVQGQDGKNANLTMRWQDVDYFQKVLAKVLGVIETGHPVRIYLFSQGEQEEFANFQKLGDVEYCLDMDAYASFLHMVNADLLITSKSSFSYKPALLSRGIKVCPRDFWHGYPDGDDWILAEADGDLTLESTMQLREALVRSPLFALAATPQGNIFE